MRKLLLTLLCVAALLSLAACGGSSSSSNRTPVPPPPSGGNNAGFTNASLNGDYVFSANGAGTSSLFAVAGKFTADGNGTITSGTRDTVNDAGGQTLNEAITGTYSVNQDGRGQVVLNGTSGQVIYRFVLRGSGEATLFQISNTFDATGRIFPQPQVQAALVPEQVTYLVRFDGEDSGHNTYGAVGALTFSNSAGTITGTLDENDNGTFRSQQAVTGTFSSTNLGTRGTAKIVTPAGTHNFIIYPVGVSRVLFVSTDRNVFLHGTGEVQGAAPATSIAAFRGDQVFSISGADSNGTIIETGRLTLDGNGNIFNAIEDYNEAGFFFDGVTFTGTYAITANTPGRWTATFTFSSSTMSIVGWQVSPAMSVIIVSGTNISNFRIVETGVMRVQAVGITTSGLSGPYAEELSGILAGAGNVESAGNFDIDAAGNMSGTIDSQTPTSINTDVSQTGNYSVNPVNGRSSGTIGAVPVHLYVADSSLVYLISSDPGRLYQGTLQKQ